MIENMKTLKGVVILMALALLSAASQPVFCETTSIPSEQGDSVQIEAEPGHSPAVEQLPFESVVVDARNLLVRLGPSSKSKRRGVVKKGSRLPVYERADGPGCKGYWYRIYEDAWVCESGVTASNLAPAAPRYPILPDGEITPWPYAFVRESAIEYKKSGGIYEEIREVFKGYGFGVAGTTYIDGEKYFRSVQGRLIPKRAAGISGRISEYSGIEIGGDYQLPIGWVNSKKAWAYSEPSRRKKFKISKVERYDIFDVLEERGENHRRFVRFDEGAWLAGTDVRVARRSERPDSVGPEERWIDVDLKEQVITAYMGDTPVFTTMISAGRGGGSRTVKGEYRIWVKVSAIAMDNTDEELEEEESDEGVEADAGVSDDRHLFSLHDVPWTQFFFENYALHGVYWHDRFGNRRSHGCVNLSPSDAHWFYEWTEPALPDGWWAIHTTPGEKGTLVRIR